MHTLIQSFACSKHSTAALKGLSRRFDQLVGFYRNHWINILAFDNKCDTIYPPFLA